MLESLKWLLLPLFVMFAVAAQAETVVGDRVNCRSAARATAPVLVVLRRGQAVSVRSTFGVWSYVEPVSLPACYVRFNLLSSAAVAMAGSYRSSSTRAHASRSSHQRSQGLYSTRRYAISSKVRSSSTRTRGRSRGFYDGGSSCPCSGSHVCIGPRGGRYCITSGGNKRYGV